MLYNKLPGTELEISALTIGTWLMGADKMWGPADDEDSIQAIHAALDHGANIIDTAPIYGNGHSEEVVGRALKGRSADIIVATKCGLLNDNGRISQTLKPESIRSEVEVSLKRLGRDRIDIYQCHWPDKKTPIEDTMSELLKLQEQGKIRYIGVSNYDAALLADACAHAPVVSLQSQYSLLHREQEEEGILSSCVEKNVGFLAYGPLGGGILTGKYKKQPNFAKADARSFFYPFYKEPLWSQVYKALEQTREFADSIGRSLNEVILGATVATEGITSLIVGCRNTKQAQQNATAFAVEMDAEKVEKVKSFFAGIGNRKWKRL